jgi:hypothetical protein
MGPKLLFFFGIVVTHGAVGAALMRQEVRSRTVVTSRPRPACSPPTPLPYFGARGDLEMLAQVLPAENPPENDSGATRP